MKKLLLSLSSRLSSRNLESLSELASLETLNIRDPGKTKTSSRFAAFRALVGMTILCLFINPVYAVTPAEHLTQLLSDLKTMRAQFTQRVVDKKGTTIQEANGQMALQRPGRFRWDTQSTSQQIVADGKKVWIYDADLQQVTVQKQDMDSLQSPAVLLSGSINSLKNKFKITELKRNEPGFWFELKPVYKNAPFRSVELHFVNGQLQSMRLSDAIGHSSLLTFSRVEMNIELPASIFNFRVPPNVDVVDQS